MDRKEDPAEKLRLALRFLLGVLLASILVGVVWARPKGHHGGYHYAATVSAGAFLPHSDDVDYVNGGDAVWLGSGSATGYFSAAVPILPGNRTVESLTLVGMDNNGSAEACVQLTRTKTD